MHQSVTLVRPLTVASLYQWANDCSKITSQHLQPPNHHRNEWLKHKSDNYLYRITTQYPHTASSEPQLPIVNPACTPPRPGNWHAAAYPKAATWISAQWMGVSVKYDEPQMGSDWKPRIYDPSVQENHGNICVSDGEIDQLLAVVGSNLGCPAHDAKSCQSWIPRLKFGCQGHGYWTATTSTHWTVSSEL